MNVDQLPELSREYVLTEDQICEYQRDGHILLRQVATSVEVAAYEELIATVAMQHNEERRALGERDTYGKAFLQIGNLFSKHEGVRRFITARRFAKIAAELMGVDAVRVYWDQALFKEPGGGHTPWHQDQTYWPLKTDKTITMWMPLVDIPADVGSMTFVSGSHALGWIAKEVISDSSQVFFDKFMQERNLPRITHGAMKAGDATFHAGWTLHSAPGNPSDKMREVMTVIYMADGARIAQPETKSQEGELALVFPGLKPGDLAAGPLNPIVYKL